MDWRAAVMTFAKKMKEIEREINELKTHGLRSSSSLALTSRSISVTQQIVGYTVNYPNDNCAGQSAALIKLTPDDGKSMLTMACIASNSNELIGRRIVLRKIVIDGGIGYEFRIVAGSPSDLATIQGGGSIPAITFDIEIYATSEFSATLTYRQDH